MDTGWSFEGPRTVDIDGVTDLRAAIAGGRLDVVTHDEPVTRIQVSELWGGPVTAELHAGTLTVRHGLRFPGNGLRVLRPGHNDRVVISIAVPAGISVAAATVSGDGMVAGASVRTSLETVSGSMLADDTAGPLTAETVSGEIIVRRHSGPLVAKSVSGEITASGYLSNIRANTISGNLSFDVLGGQEDLAARSVSGDLTVRLAAGAGLDVRTQTLSGTVSIDEHRYSAGIGQSVRASVPGTGRAMRLRTSSVTGNLSVLHRRHTAPREDSR